MTDDEWRRRLDLEERAVWQAQREIREIEETLGPSPTRARQAAGCARIQRLEERLK